MSTLSQSDLLLTPNASLAQQLRRKKLQETGASSAQKAPVQVLQNWLLESIQPERPLATDTQLLLAWKQIIAEQRDRESRFSQLNPDFLGESALHAWRLLKQWQIPIEELRKAETGQLLSFSHWVSAFEKRLQQLNLTTVELEIEQRLYAETMQETEKEIPKHPAVSLYAFVDTPAPLWMHWLQDHFEEVRPLDYIGSMARAQCCTTSKPVDEIETALSWADQVLKQKPAARVAIIDLSLNKRLKINQRLAKLLISPKHSVHFSRDLPAGLQGPVQTALSLLRLNDENLNLACARLITQSPHWGDFQAEYSVRAEWDKALCALQQSRLTFSAFIGALENLEDSHQVLKQQLNRAFSDRRQIKTLLPLDWADRFQQQLLALGVFSASPDYSWQAWHELLDEFRSLGHVTGKIDLVQALQLLQNLSEKSRPHSISAGHGLAILDTVEAAADYSHIWLMGTDNQQWPSAPQPNALLPVSLQIRYQLPRTSVAQESELAQRLIERLKTAGQEVVFSHAQYQEDREVSASHLVTDLPAYKPETQNRETFAPAAMQWLDCSQAPAVPVEETRVRGGSALLKTMAASPFDAFAYWRLNAEELDQPQIGLSAMDRGNLVHDILESVWARLENAQNLAQLSDQELSNLCREFSTACLRKYSRRFGPAYLALEAQRLTELTQKWLELEKCRPAFTVELAEEQLEAEIGGLSFRLRLDRLDRLEDGRLLLIDYKTGNQLSRNDWLDMPPSEPQLPLYALTLKEPPNALCFARVRAEKLEFIGIGEEELFTGIQAREDWDSLLTQWQTTLATLAQAYIRGETTVFETQVGFFGQTDPLAPLHRFAEKDALEAHSEAFKMVASNKVAFNKTPSKKVSS